MHTLAHIMLAASVLPHGAQTGRVTQFYSPEDGSFVMKRIMHSRTDGQAIAQTAEWSHRRQSELPAHGVAMAPSPRRAMTPYLTKRALVLRGGSTNFNLLFELASAVRVPGLSRVLLVSLAAVFTLQVCGIVDTDRWAHIDECVDAGEFYRMSTSTFLHADLRHLACNSLSLAAMTPRVEATFGTLGAICIFLLTGICGSCGGRVFGYDLGLRLEIALLNCLSEFGVGHRRFGVERVDSRRVMSIGASGAAFGFTGSLVGSQIRNPSLAGFKDPLAYLAMLFARDIYIAWVDPDGGQINHAAHLAGGVTGVCFGLALSPNVRYHGFDRWLHARFMLLFAVNGGLHIAALLKAMGLLGLPWSVLKGLVPSRANQRRSETQT